MSWTLLQIKTKTNLDLDLQEDSIVTSAELTGYVNDAHRDARAIISDLEQDYFLKSAFLSLVSGTAEYVLPADCYLSKIRGIIFQNGSTEFEVKRIKTYKKFARIVEYGDGADGSSYRYLILEYSAAAGGVKIQLVPAAQLTSALVMKVWYLRDIVTLSADADVSDLDEFINYIFAHVKRSCLTKINGGITPPSAQAAVDVQEKLLVETMENMSPDTDDEIEGDFTHYEEHT